VRLILGWRHFENCVVDWNRQDGPKQRLRDGKPSALVETIASFVNVGQVEGLKRAVVVAMPAILGHVSSTTGMHYFERVGEEEGERHAAKGSAHCSEVVLE
jgi:hypothetical protein